jgi:hypothetical protein
MYDSIHLAMAKQYNLNLFHACETMQGEDILSDCDFSYSFRSIRRLGALTG